MSFHQTPVSSDALVMSHRTVVNVSPFNYINITQLSLICQELNCGDMDIFTSV